MVQMSSQPEISTSMTSAPPTARSTKPLATASTSTMTTCFSHTE
jgi:hypothetical protein